MGRKKDDFAALQKALARTPHPLVARMCRNVIPAKAGIQYKNK